MGPMLAYRAMVRFALALLAGLCAASPCAFAAQEAGARALRATLAPGQSHEECMRLAKGETRRWHWKSDAPVDFNIHYHEGPEVFYPVRRNAMRGDGGTFRAKSEQDYCWMWTARGASARLEGSIADR